MRPSLNSGFGGLEWGVTSLVDAQPGVCGSVAKADLDAKDAALLRAMGLSPNVRVRVCRRGTPCIVEIVGREGREGCGCRIGLSPELARHIFIDSVND